MSDDRLFELVDQHRPEGDYVAAIVAAKVVAYCAESEPETLDAWLHDHAERFLTVVIGDRDRAIRARTLRRAKAHAFAEAAELAEQGEWEPLSHFAVTYIVDDDDTRRRVADMTGEDHRFVASGYEASGKYDLMCGAFHRAVAKKVGRCRTADVLDEERYHDLFRSIVKADK